MARVCARRFGLQRGKRTGEIRRRRSFTSIRLGIRVKLSGFGIIRGCGLRLATCAETLPGNLWRRGLRFCPRSRLCMGRNCSTGNIFLGSRCWDFLRCLAGGSAWLWRSGWFSGVELRARGALLHRQECLCYWLLRDTSPPQGAVFSGCCARRMPAGTPALLGGGFGHEFCASALHFFGSYVFYVRGNAPVVAGWVGDFAVAIAPEHILYGHGAFCAGFY